MCVCWLGGLGIVFCGILGYVGHGILGMCIEKILLVILLLFNVTKKIATKEPGFECVRRVKGLDKNKKINFKKKHLFSFHLSDSNT